MSGLAVFAHTAFLCSVQIMSNEIVRNRKIVIDTDPGVDDAFAILLASRWFEKENILALTTTAGNVGLETTTHNALGLKRLLHASFEVYQGARKPLQVPLEDASHIHGRLGMGEYEFLETSALTSSEKAWDALYRIAKSEGGITLIALGPLTNIAIALEQHPDLPRYIDALYTMGGSTQGGNRTPYAEFNYYCDPHAAHRVYESGMNIFMIGLNVTELAYADEATMAALSPLDADVKGLIDSLKDHYSGTLAGMSSRKGSHLPDAVAVAACIDPDLCSYREVPILIETLDQNRRGMSRMDETGRCPVQVALEVDVTRFREMLLSINELNC